MRIGEERNGFYYLDPTRFCSNADNSNELLTACTTFSCKSFTSSVNTESVNNTKDLLWHQRLGHPSISRCTC